MKSPKEASRLLSCREPVERALLLTVLLCLCSMHAPAQNIEGQVVASQYGEWKVPSIGIGFTFDPASCQLSGGGKNFPAFSNGTPIKVVDENPGLTEVSNATVYAHLDSSSCSVSLGGLTYGHTSFYLTSGTGGLQEALSNASIRVGGPNTIILNAEWYELVSPGNPATVIGAVTGGSGFGLVDVTTAPYTYYSWSGGHFNVVSSGGGSPTGPAGGALSGTYPNPALSSSLVLPPATTATTQSNGDNSTKVATTAYVAANSSGAPTGSAGGSLSGTYPNPGLSSTVAIPSGATAMTQTTGDNSTKVATDAFVQASLPSIPVSSVFGRVGAVAASSGDYSVSQVTGAAPLASPAFTGTPTAPTQTTGDNTTRVATDAFVQASLPSVPVSSVFGRAGAVAATSGDYSVSQVTGAAPLASPALTGTPTAPTQSTGDNSTRIATDAFVLANGSGVTWPTSAGIVLSNGTNSPAGLAPVNGDCVVGSGGAWTAASCPGGGGTTTNALTLNNSGSGASSGATFNGAAAVTLSYNTIGAAPLASPALAGTPTAPTQTTADTSTDIATDAFVHNNLASYAPVASPTLTGTPTAPTQSCASNTDIATGAYVANCAAGGAPALSSITAATASSSINNGNNLWQLNYHLTGSPAPEAAFTVSESSASTATANPLYLAFFATLAGSTLSPLAAQNSLTGSQVLPAFQVLPTWNTTGNAVGFLNSITSAANGSGSLAESVLYNAGSIRSLDYLGNQTIAGTMTASKFVSSNTVNNSEMTFTTGSSGDSTCPSALSGTSYLCTKSSGISASVNGAGYAPLDLNLASSTATLSSGTVTVSTSAACSPGSSCVYTFTNCGKNASSGIGTLSLGTVSAGTSFVINSLGPTASVLTTDASTVCWRINP